MCVGAGSQCEGETKSIAPAAGVTMPLPAWPYIKTARNPYQKDRLFVAVLALLAFVL